MRGKLIGGLLLAAGTLLSCDGGDGADNKLLFLNGISTLELGETTSAHRGEKPSLTAKNRSYTMYLDQKQKIQLAGAGARYLRYVISEEPTSGKLMGFGKKRYYKPNPGFSGEDSFEYYVKHRGVESEKARVYIRIVNNQCSSAQNGAGPTDAIFAHIPLHTVNKDISANQFPVKVRDFAGADDAWKSRTDLSKKRVTAYTSHLSGPFSVSFRFQPTDGSLEQTLVGNRNLKISSVNGGVQVRLKQKWRSDIVLSNNASTLKTGSCNHFALSVTDTGIQTWLNGNLVDTQVDTGKIKALGHRWTMGLYSGQFWEFRVYERSLLESEVQTLGEDCADAQTKESPQAGYPNYLCGPYVCEWWPADADLETGEDVIPAATYEYYLKSQNMVFERTIFDAGMFPRDDFCGYYENGAGRDLILSYGIRKTFVKNFSEDNTVNQYWLHENFHSFQGNLKRYTGFGGNKFLLESSASWGPDSIIAGTDKATDSLLGMYTLVPHIPLWSDQSSPIEDSIESRFKGGHQYGAFIFLAYLTRHTLGSDMLVGDIFNDTRASSTPIEVVNERLTRAGYDLRDEFAEFAVRTINFDYEHGDAYAVSEEASRVRMYRNDPDPDFAGYKISAEFGTEGTGNVWTAVPANLKPGAWAYNAFKVTAETGATYAVEFRPSTDNPAHAEFRGRVAVKSTDGSIRYYSLPDAAGGEAVKVMVSTVDGDEIYLVVSSTPSTVFSGFESFTYDYKIYK